LNSNAAQSLAFILIVHVIAGAWLTQYQVNREQFTQGNKKNTSHKYLLSRSRCVQKLAV